MSRDTFSKCTYLFGYKPLHGLILRSEMFHKVLADSIIFRFSKSPPDIFIHQFPVFQFQSDIHIREHHPVAGRVNNQDRISDNIHHLLTFTGMIMPH